MTDKPKNKGGRPKKTDKLVRKNLFLTPEATEVLATKEKPGLYASEAILEKSKIEKEK
jgi:hypothetical protein